MSPLLGVGVPIPPPTTPPVPLPSGAPIRTPLRHLWRGWNGSTFDLTGRDPTGVFFRPGVRGMNAAKVQPYLSELAGVNGSRPRGHRLPSREVFWPISVWAEGDSQAWIDYDAAFWTTLQPGRVGVWEVQQPNGDVRRLRCTFVSDGDHAHDWDGAQRGWMQYGVYLRADQPLWEGLPVRPPAWAAGGQENFYGGNAGGGFGPPYYISSALTLASAVIDNPGNVPASVLWTIQAQPGAGGVTSAAVGVGGRVVEVPFTIAAGYQVVVDTDPTAQTALYGPIPAAGEAFVGAERTRDLGAAAFASVPDGKSQALSLSMVGVGTVQAELTPRYYRATG